MYILSYNKAVRNHSALGIDFFGVISWSNLFRVVSAFLDLGIHGKPDPDPYHTAGSVSP